MLQVRNTLSQTHSFYALRFMFSFRPHDVFFYHARNEYVYGISVNNEHLIAQLHDA